jgi:peroxiredoxin
VYADPWVMREWSHKLNNDLSKVAMLADGEGGFHAKLGKGDRPIRQLSIVQLNAISG